MRKFILGFYLLSLSWLAMAQSYPVNNNQDIVHYTFSITVNDSSKEIRGESRILFTLDNTEELVLDFVNQDDDGLGMVVNRISLAGRDLAFAHEQNRLKIDIDSTGNQPFEIIINYHGVPLNGLIIADNKFSQRVFFGDNYPDRARNWLPCVDHPADKATVTWVITAPAHYKVVASGKLVSEKPTGNSFVTTTWDEKVPISTKVMVFGAADFAIDEAGRLRDIPVTTWVYEQNKAAGFNDFAIAPKVLAYYDSLIGPYPYEKLANVQSKTMYGGMENAGNIFYYENSVTGQRKLENLIAHEIVHQWFGNSATEADWPHAWLSEGFATYLTHVYVGSRFGEQKMLEGLKTNRQRVIDYWYNSPLPIVNTNLVTYPQIASLRELLSTNTYQKGGWVLHMLRHELGDETFWQGVRQYYKKYASSTATTDDLRKVFTDVSGKDLVPFFNQWLYGMGQPALTGEWLYKKGEINVAISQTQEQLFAFPLEIGLVYPDKTIIKRLDITTANESFSFTAEEPDKIIFDPNIKLLYEGSDVLIAGTAESTTVTTATLNNKWLLTELNGELINGANSPVITFHSQDNRISGNAGCNNYQGGYREKGRKLIFDENMIATRMMCDNMAVEDAFLKALKGGKFAYNIETNTLTLRQKGKAVLVFKKID